MENQATNSIVTPNQTLLTPIINNENDLTFDAEQINNQVMSKIDRAEIESLAKEVNIDEPNSIIYFGSKTANKIIANCFI